MDSQIRLRIAGIRERKSGFTPLVAVGDAFDIVMDKGVSTISESPYYVVRHTSDDVIYLLVDTEVCSYDVGTRGVLCIALAWPANKKLAGNKSPYSLLSAVYKTFQALYMRPSENRYLFTDTTIDHEIFERIVESCHLEPSSGNYVPMEGMLTGIICVPMEKLDAFFRDTQYPEFRKYKDIEIGTSCQSQATPELTGLEIPRPVSYEVWVNGQSTSFFLSRNEDSYTASAPSTSTYEYESVSFTLGELLGSKNGELLKGKDSVIRLDVGHERIDCQLKKKEISYLVRLGWVNLSEASRTEILGLLKEKKLGIKLDGILLEWKDKVYVPASRIYAPVTLNFSQWGGYNLSVSSSVDSSTRVLTITIKGQSVQMQGNKQMRDNVFSAHVDENVMLDEMSSGSSQISRMDRWRNFRGGLVVGILLGVGGTFLWQNLSEKAHVVIPDRTPTVENEVEAEKEVATNLPEENVPVESDSLFQEDAERAAAAKAAADAKVAAAKAAADAKVAADAKAAARIEIQQLVIAGDIAACRAHPGWNKYLTRIERYTVENLLNLEGRTGVVKKNLENLRKIYQPAFTWELVEFLNKEIVRIENNGISN